MKKGLIIGVVVVVVLLLFGGVMFFKGDKKTADNSAGQINTEQAKTEQGSVSGDSGSGLLDTAAKIKDAMLGGKKMECSFKDLAGNGTTTEMKMQSQGKKFRSSYVVSGETFTSVSDGETVYSWSSKAKEGTKMNLKCMEDLSKTVPQAKDAAGDKIDSQDPETLVDNTPGMNCVPISDVDFSVPSDVNFVDTCEQLKNVFESMKDLNVNLPKGVGLPPVSE
jgi:outer membrane lipoprotein-sorting protein